MLATSVTNTQLYAGAARLAAEQRRNSSVGHQLLDINSVSSVAVSPPDPAVNGEAAPNKLDDAKGPGPL